MSRYARRVDDNQKAIVAALRAHGATVQSLAAVGAGVPDLLVGYRGRTLLLEIKDGAKPPSDRVLTEAEDKWHKAWRGGALAVVESIEDAVAELKSLGSRP